MAKIVVDLSKYNRTNINWSTLSKNVAGVILRAGYRGYGASGTMRLDTNFDTFNKGAKAAGIPTGVYYYSQATTEREARNEADVAIQQYEKTNKKLGIWYDTEYTSDRPNGRMDKLSKAQRTAVTIAFIGRCKEKGYPCGIYASASYLKEALDWNRVRNYPLWVANYGSKKNSDYGIFDPYMWQYSSKGSVPGISSADNGKRLDVSYLYHTMATSSSSIHKSTKELAQEVIDGKWGNGDERKKKLTAAGYDYSAVQKEVNALLKKGG